MDNIIAKFVAAAIIQVQLDVVERYRRGQKGKMTIAMTTKDDRFMDLTERAICRLGFANEDFPPMPEFDHTFTTVPCDIEEVTAREDKARLDAERARVGLPAAPPWSL